jgi:SAM-dependent methyltransferase
MTAPREPSVGDAFGAALLACLESGIEPGAVPEVVERDDGLISVSDIARYFSPPRGAQAEWIIERAAGRVLDIGAGAGRYALALQERGLAVTALDISAGALEVCRRRGVNATFHGTLTDFADSTTERFDTLLLMGANLGLLGAPADTPGFLHALTQLAAPHGRVLAEGSDGGATDDPIHLNYHEASARAGLPRHLVRLRVRHRDIATEWFDYLRPDLEELSRLIESSDWAISDQALLPGMSAASYVVELTQG